LIKTFLAVCGHCLYSALRNPRSVITQVGNPLPLQQSPIPWWGSIAVLLMGIVSWCLSAHYGISGLGEAARAMVYIPLGNIFGLTSISVKAIQKTHKPPGD